MKNFDERTGISRAVFRGMLHLMCFCPFHILEDGIYLRIRYWIRTGKRLNLNNPVTYNEKLQWLKLHDNNPQYSRMVDKLGMRGFVAERIGDGYSVPILWVWDRAADINFDSLPDEFVLKCNHDSGSTLVITDKYRLNRKKVVGYFRKKLKQNYYYKSRERQYKDIEPKIICEEYLNDGSPLGLRDYKVFCFNGKAKFVRVSYQGKTGQLKSEFDINWNLIEDAMRFDYDGTQIERPILLDEMFLLAEKLSDGFIHLRVDFYEVRGKLFIGELTLCHGEGMNWFPNTEVEKKMGSYLNIDEM